MAKIEETQSHIIRMFRFIVLVSGVDQQNEQLCGVPVRLVRELEWAVLYVGTGNEVPGSGRHKAKW